MRDKIINLSFLIGSAILILAFSILNISSVLFFLHFSISSLSVFLAIFITLVFCWQGTKRYLRKERIKFFVIAVLCLTILVTASLYVSGLFYDISCDGQMYHQEAIIQLKEGWNPLYQRLSLPKVKDLINLQMNCFSKAPWIYAAVLYKTTNHIEPSKAFNLLFIFASFLLSLSCLLTLKWLKPFIAILISLILSFNPISICQSLTFYVDGQLSSLLVCLASLLYLLFMGKNKLTLLIFTVTFIMLINIKLSAPVYAAILISGALILFFIYKKKELGLKLAKVSLLSFFLGIFFIGYNPYITNTIHHQNPLYPVVGRESGYLMAGQMPENFYSLNRLQKFFVSLFSKCDNSPTPATTSFKFPLTISKDELPPFIGADVRTSGFGPLFSAAIILALIIFIGCITNFKNAALGIGIILLLLGSCLINPQAWWARFVPQLWIAPVISILVSLYNKNKVLRLLGYLVVCILCVNILVISWAFFYQQNYWNQRLSQQINLLAASSHCYAVDVKFNAFRSGRIRLKEKGVKFKEVEKLPCREPIPLIGFGARPIEVCLSQKRKSYTKQKKKNSPTLSFISIKQ